MRAETMVAVAMFRPEADAEAAAERVGTKGMPTEATAAAMVVVVVAADVAAEQRSFTRHQCPFTSGLII
jgi:hypothetical protein